MKNVLKALQNARLYISEKKFTKKGRNNFSKYDYFTPEQIFDITLKAEFDNGLFSKFDLIEENNIIFGVLTIYHVESGESLEFKMRSDIPDIKATNLTQKLGGAVTYTHRYLLTNAYKIAENQLDFDSDQNTLAKKTEQKTEITWLSQNQFEKALKASNKQIQNVLEKYNTDTHKMKKEYKETLEGLLNK